MLKNLSLALILIFISISISVCGSSGTIDKVCGAAASKIFKECSKSNAADVQTIIDAYAQFGVTVTEDDIQSATEGSLKSDCVNDLKESGATINAAEADAFAVGLNQLSSCEDVANYVVAGINSL